MSFASKARIAVSVVLFTESKLTLQDDRHTKLKYLVAWLLGSGSMKDRARNPHERFAELPHVSEDISICATTREKAGRVGGSLQISLGTGMPETWTSV